MPTDKFVLQHDATGTIHELRKDGNALCGKKKTEKYKRRKLSKALEHPLARACGKEKPKGFKY